MKAESGTTPLGGHGWRGFGLLPTSLVPGLFLFFVGLLTSEYWSRIYMIWGGAFALISLLLVFRRCRAADAAGRRPSFKAVMLSFLHAWLIAGVVLIAIDLTPLCAGQDNGDGRNSVETCVILTALWFLSMSIPVGCISAAVSALLVKSSARTRV